MRNTSSAIDDNLALVRNMEEDLFNHRDPSAVDRYVSPDYTLRTAGAGAPSGREAVRTYIAAYLAGFPDLCISIDQLLAVGDKVIGVFTFTGTHHGDLFGVTPSGRSISVRQIAIYRVEDGQVVDEWEISDQLGLMQQIGVHAG
ncbi:MAG TPA: ester cyclase [Candidatus Dormibacteraeota bacterium]|nr:ester cyclase [Candidatus Dormibacteraeota bacterium]